MILLEPDGALLCSGAPGLRVIAAALPDGNGGYFVVTADLRGSFAFSPAEDWDVFLIHLDSGLRSIPVGDGVYAEDPCGAILLGGNAAQRISQALTLKPGRFLVTGSDERDGPPRVFLQAFDADGHGLLGRVPVVVSDLAIDSRFPAAVPDEQGGLLFAWTEFGPRFESRLLLQRLSENGIALWDRPVVVSAGGSVFGASTDLAPDGEGGAYVAWDELRAGEPDDGYHLRVQRVGQDGLVRWTPGGLRPWDGAPEKPDARLVGDGPGGVIVLFAGGAMRAQKFSPSGKRLWGDAGLPLSDLAAAGDTGSPDVSISLDDSLYVTWLERRTGSENRIFVRRLERDGTNPWPSPMAALSHRFGVGRRSQTVLSDGSLAIVWEDFREDVSIGTADLYVQTFDRRGRRKTFADGLPIVVAPGRQSVPLVFAPDLPGPPDGEGAGTALPEAIVAWSDTRWPSLWGSSESLLVQKARFSSSPRLDPVAVSGLLQSSTTTLALHGDDLQPGLTVDAGAGILVEEAAITADSEGGPGDTLQVRLRADPAAPLGPRDLAATNPDGGSTLLPAFLRIDLDPRRIDVDRSGRADGFDLAVLARSFGRTAGEVLYALDADIDVSGQVDGTDLALLASRFGDQIAGLPAAAR